MKCFPCKVRGSLRLGIFLFNRCAIFLLHAFIYRGNDLSFLIGLLGLMQVMAIGGTVTVRANPSR